MIVHCDVFLSPLYCLLTDFIWWFTCFNGIHTYYSGTCASQTPTCQEIVQPTPVLNLPFLINLNMVIQLASWKVFILTFVYRHYIKLVCKTKKFIENGNILVGVLFSIWTINWFLRMLLIIIWYQILIVIIPFWWYFLCVGNVSFDSYIYVRFNSPWSLVKVWTSGTDRDS